MEQTTGLEPAQSAWKAEVLPLNTMSAYGVLSGIRTPGTVIKSHVLYLLS